MILSTIVTVPSQLNLVGTIKFINSLIEQPNSKEYLIDFGVLKWIEPFALLCLAYQLRKYRKSKPDCIFRAINYENGLANSYAAHMGFFRAFGLEHGELPRASMEGKRYTPIRIISLETLRRRARENKIRIEEQLEKYAKEISCKLTQEDSGELIEILTFSIREMFRNIIDHSLATQLAYCLQYFPKNNTVEVAILDNGTGLRKSLIRNPNLAEVNSDREAVLYSLLPGVSGNMYKGKIHDPNDPWENSGYGLFMASELCKKGGSFFICSYKSGVLLNNQGKIEYCTNIEGTALRLFININEIDSITKSLSEIHKKGIFLAKSINFANITPSKASSMLATK